MFHLDSLKYMHRSDKEHINILQNKFKKGLAKQKQINMKRHGPVRQLSQQKKKNIRLIFFFLVAQFGPVQKL